MKKVVHKAGHYLALATTLVVFLISCANPVADMSSSAALGEAAARATVAPTQTSSYTLWAGQHINAGTVSFAKDASNLYITYATSSDYLIQTTHVWVGTDPSAVPQNKNGIPVPGQFKTPGTGNFGSEVNYDPTVSTATITVPLTWPAGTKLAIYAHAALVGATPSIAGQTGFGGDIGVNIADNGRWYYYIDGLDPRGVPDLPTTTTTVPVATTTTTTIPNIVYYSLSGTVFHDLNSDGVLNGSETGLSGVTLTLNGGASAVSGTDGTYTFTGLLPGAYTVTSGGKAGYFATPYDTPVESKSATIAASSVSGLNFGLSYESISGFAFKDTNADGVKAASDSGIGGVAIGLSGAASASATTGSDGSYLFDHLKGGSASYTVASGNVSGEFHTPYLAPVTSWTGTASAANVNFGYSHETVTGVIFYDANKNDGYLSGEPLLGGFTVRLSNGASATSAADGSYTFDNLPGATTYTVSVDDRAGFVHSVAASRGVAPANSVPGVVNLGFAVDYSWINGKLANGFTIGYWKTNLDKAIANKTNGIQVSKAALQGYVDQLSGFALWPLNPATLQAASDILSKTGSLPTDLLAKQLMGSEFNYASGAYIGGNALATSFFLFDGEYMLANAGSFGSAQLLAQKDKYDAYNNSHGGAVIF